MWFWERAVEAGSRGGGDRGAPRPRGSCCYLVPISANPKGPRLPPLSFRRESSQANRGKLWRAEVLMEKGGALRPAVTSALLGWLLEERFLWCIQEFNRMNICLSADLWETCAWHIRWCCITNLKNHGKLLYNAQVEGDIFQNSTKPQMTKYCLVWKSWTGVDVIWTPGYDLMASGLVRCWFLQRCSDIPWTDLS